MDIPYVRKLSVGDAPDDKQIRHIPYVRKLSVCPSTLRAWPEILFRRVSRANISSQLKLLLRVIWNQQPPAEMLDH